MMIFGTIGILVVLYLLFRNDAFAKRHTTSEKGEDALTILKRRYAEGQITEEEFIRMRDEVNRK